MTRRAECGKLPPAKNRVPYCPVCDALTELDLDLTEDEWEPRAELIYVKADRIHKIRTAYGRRRR